MAVGFQQKSLFRAIVNYVYVLGIADYWSCFAHYIAHAITNIWLRSETIGLVYRKFGLQLKCMIGLCCSKGPMGFG